MPTIESAADPYTKSVMLPRIPPSGAHLYRRLAEEATRCGFARCVTGPGQHFIQPGRPRVRDACQREAGGRLDGCTCRLGCAGKGLTGRQLAGRNRGSRRLQCRHSCNTRANRPPALPGEALGHLKPLQGLGESGVRGQGHKHIGV